MPGLRRLFRIRHAPFLLTGLVLLLLIGRAVLPYALHRYVENTLNKIPEYQARVGEISVHLWRGAYTIESLIIEKKTGKVPVPFYSSKDIDIAVQWRELFRGAVVGEINLNHPKLNFVTSTDSRAAQTGISATVTDQIKQLFPVRINHVGVKDGEIHYRDFQSDPQIDVKVERLNGVIVNLTNSQHLSRSMVASADFRGVAENTGKFTLSSKFDPYKKSKTFDGSLAIEGLHLTELNDFLRAYGNFDAESGTINLYGQISAAHDRVNGYVKPLIQDLHILRWKETPLGVLQYLWEGVLSGFLEVFKNHRHDQIATIVRFSGDIKDPETSIWEMVTSFFGNGLIKALKPGLENSVDLTAPPASS